MMEERGKTKVKDAAPATDDDKKAGRGLKVATVVASVIAVVGLAAGACFFVAANESAKENAALRAKLDLIQAETGVELVEQVADDGNIVATVESSEDEVKDLVLALRDELEESVRGGVEIEAVFGGGIYTARPDTARPAYIKLPGSDVYTVANQYYGVLPYFEYDFSTAEEYEYVADVWGMVTDYLTFNGFSKVRSMAFGDDVYGNTETGIYCTVLPLGVKYGFDSVRCASGDWYDVGTKDLIVALAKASGYDYIELTSRSEIKDSEVSPYQTLEASLDVAALFFYRVSPDADWQFFTGAQALIGCDAYNTQDLKNAYAGEMCWNDTTNLESTVQP